jgi:hypothetical protein
MTGTLHENQCTFMITRRIFIEWEIFQMNNVQKIKPHILCSITFFPPDNRAVYEIMWKIW